MNGNNVEPAMVTLTCKCGKSAMFPFSQAVRACWFGELEAIDRWLLVSYGIGHGVGVTCRWCRTTSAL